MEHCLCQGVKPKQYQPLSLRLTLLLSKNELHDYINYTVSDQINGDSLVVTVHFVRNKLQIIKQFIINSACIIMIVHYLQKKDCLFQTF